MLTELMPLAGSLSEPEFSHEALTVALAKSLMPLAELHYKEIAHFKDIPLDPDFEKYAELERRGSIRCYLASIAGEVVGYAIYIVSINLRYQSSKQAHQDVIFIHPERRGFGKRFIAWCDEQLKEDGVEVVYHHVKESNNFGPLLERLGYDRIEVIYGRKL